MSPAVAARLAVVGWGAIGLSRAPAPADGVEASAGMAGDEALKGEPRQPRSGAGLRNPARGPAH